MASYNVKHTILNELQVEIELTTGPLPKRMADELLFSLARASEYRGGTVEFARPVSRRSRVTLPKKGGK